MNTFRNYIMGSILTAGIMMAGASSALAAGKPSGWQGNDVDGWYYYHNNAKVTGWQQIKGIWYWFDKTGRMAMDELVYITGETYYFNPAGAMATGWYEFDRDDDIINNYEIDVDEAISNIQNPVFKDAADSYDTVWLYFHKNGTAATDEWIQSDVSGLWYYFDELLMVKADFDHIIGNYRYGFDENGAMLVGWNYNYNNQTILAPNKSSNTWYYYASNGKKFDVDSLDNGFGWKKIDGKWYCFKSELNMASGNSVGTLIVDTLFNNAAAADNDTDFYYVDKDGVMLTGVNTISKNSGYVETREDWGSSKKVGDYFNNSVEIYFKDGKAVSGIMEKNRYYAALDDEDVKSFDTKTFAVTGYPVKLQGSLVKNCFVTKEQNTYYMDRYGDKVTSYALQIGYVKVTDTNGVKSYEFSRERTNATNEYRAYLIFDGRGTANDNIAEGRSVSAGSKKYYSTGIDYDTKDGVSNATIFYYK